MAWRWLEVLGVERQRVSHTERWVSGGGAFVGILTVFALAWAGAMAPGGPLVVASMGASAVLLFAVPHSPLAQPWPVLGGHLLSAVVGVAVALAVPQPLVAGPLAVALAVLVMHYARCIHPPGGATALSAVLLGAAVHDVGFGYVLRPVGLDALAIVLAAVAWNLPFRWRRYPLALAPRARREGPSAIPHERFVYALSQLDTFMDVSEADLLRIYELATRGAGAGPGLRPEALRLGACYSNGEFGDAWSVRQIVDWDESRPPAERQLVYKVVAGAGRRTSGVTDARTFARWARHEVYRDDENWRRAGPGGGAPEGPEPRRRGEA